ncbi:phospholipase [Labrys sp. KB_33_2]|uniref:luciferase domain-containing protein n=1 Tax=Labrys sp. KB_33_2 TaxID=3237479 RepID=UPI003F92CF02
MCQICETLNLQRREGRRPKTNPRTPHMQLDQIAPPAMRDRLLAIGAELPGVTLGQSGVSVPESTAFLLAPTLAGRGDPCAFMTPGEFAHVHPIWDGSLHMNLPVQVLDKVYAANWGEQHPVAGRFGFPPNIAMIYGPRDDTEFRAVSTLLRISHAFATGGPLPE